MCAAKGSAKEYKAALQELGVDPNQLLCANVSMSLQCVHHSHNDACVMWCDRSSEWSLAASCRLWRLRSQQISWTLKSSWAPFDRQNSGTPLLFSVEVHLYLRLHYVTVQEQRQLPSLYGIYLSHAAGTGLQIAFSNGFRNRQNATLTETTGCHPHGVVMLV